MAKITYSALLGPHGEVGTFFDATLQLQGQKSTPTHVFYKDTGEGNDKISITGTGFAWEGDILTEGVIEGISFTTKTGDPYLTIKDVSFTVGEFTNAFVNNGGVQGVMDLMLSKSDTVTGSKISDLIESGEGADTVRAGAGADSIDGGDGKDRLYGEAGKDYIFGGMGPGNDRMWGGASSDSFHFSSGSGNDVIMDFDARGGGNKQDHLSLDQADTFTVKRDGNNTVLDFGEGETLTLIDVKRSDFGNADIDWLAT
jgi:Ca2+-binding RTX toxin-like protein